MFIFSTLGEKRRTWSNYVRIQECWCKIECKIFIYLIEYLRAICCFCKNSFFNPTLSQRNIAFYIDIRSKDENLHTKYFCVQKSHLRKWPLHTLELKLWFIMLYEDIFQKNNIVDGVLSYRCIDFKRLEQGTEKVPKWS